MPTEICHPCENKVLILSDFYDDSIRADMFLRSQIVTPKPTTDNIENPMLVFYETQKILTAAYKQYMQLIEPTDLSKDFDILTLDKKTIYACKFCQRLYLLPTAAMKHICSKKTSPNRTLVQTNTNGTEVVCLTSDESSSEEDDLRTKENDDKLKKRKKDCKQVDGEREESSRKKVSKTQRDDDGGFTESLRKEDCRMQVEDEGLTESKRKKDCQMQVDDEGFTESQRRKDCKMQVDGEVSTTVSMRSRKKRSKVVEGSG